MNSSKKNLITFSVLTVLGIAGLLYAVLILPRDNYQQGLIYGVTSGFILTGILGILYSLYLVRHPKKAKEVDVQKKEERTQFIRMKTASSAGQVVLYAECLAILVIGLSGYKDTSMTIAVVLFVQMIITLGFSAYYTKKY